MYGHERDRNRVEKKSQRKLDDSRREERERAGEGRGLKSIAICVKRRDRDKRNRRHEGTNE